MSDTASEWTAADGQVDQPPCLPPVEIIESGGEWLVREYHLKRGDPTVFDRHPGRLDALRAANDRMQADRHPCLLRWDAPDIVGDLYWNGLFEQLHVEYSDLLGAWVVVPAADHYVFQSGQDIEAVCNAARVVQRQYDFKEIVVFDEAGNRRETFDHRFIRHDIAASGVRFQRDRPFGTPKGASADDSGDDGADAQSDAAPTSTLMAAIPDLTDLEELETSGAVFRYRATWDNDRLSITELLNPEYVSNRDAVRRFTAIIDDWQTLSDHGGIATVYEIGPSPAAWIAYEAGSGAVADHLPDLPRASRLRILEDVAAAIDHARGQNVQPTQITPRTVRVRETDESVQGALAGWGLQWETEAVLGTRPVTPYTAPEQLDGETHATTPVYQLATLAYRLLCETEPFGDVEDRQRAIKQGSTPVPSGCADLPTAVDSVIRRGMSPVPDQRYTHAGRFVETLRSALA